VTPGVFRPSPTDELVELELTAVGRWVAEYYPCESVEELGEGRVRVALRARDHGWLVRLALRLGDSGRVISPASLDESVRAAARAALNRYESVS
jgi:proteasome accessory factor C